MSNFTCSECGMSNIDCGGAGYKTPKEIELEKENKRLQEQINNANMVINKCLTLTNDYDKKCFLEGYKIMWGLK